MRVLSFSSKLDWDCYFVFITKTASKKIGAFIRAMEFLSPEFAPYVYKSTIQPCMQNTFVTYGLIPLVATWVC